MTTKELTETPRSRVNCNLCRDHDGRFWVSRIEPSMSDGALADLVPDASVRFDTATCIGVNASFNGKSLEGIVAIHIMWLLTF